MRSALVAAALVAMCGVTACTGAGSSAHPTAVAATASPSASWRPSPPPANLVTVTSAPLSTQSVPIKLPAWHNDPVTYARQTLAVLQSVAYSQGLKTSPVSTEVVPAGKTVYCGSGIARQAVSDGSDRASYGNGVRDCASDVILISPRDFSRDIHATQYGGALGELLQAYVEADGVVFTGDKALADSFYAEGYLEGVIMFALLERQQVTDNQVIQMAEENVPYGTGGYIDGLLRVYAQSGDKYSAMFSGLLGSK